MASTKVTLYRTSFVLNLAEFEDAQKFGSAVAKYKTNTTALSHSNIEGKIEIVPGTVFV